MIRKSSSLPLIVKGMRDVISYENNIGLLILPTGVQGYLQPAYIFPSSKWRVVFEKTAFGTIIRMFW